eukprot:UN11936
MSQTISMSSWEYVKSVMYGHWYFPKYAVIESKSLCAINRFSIRSVIPLFLYIWDQAYIQDQDTETLITMWASTEQY